ncbi:MAG: peptide deformylase [bacterium]|nr:peptide deformylase [bacterium]
MTAYNLFMSPHLCYSYPMAVKDTLQMGNPRLKAKNKSIKRFDSLRLKQVVTDLVETMHQNGLVGLAAPQIGENYQVFITEPRKTKTRTADQADKLRVYINPKVVYSSKEESIIYEGCGSVAHGDLFGPVKRPKLVVIEAYDQNRQKFHLRCDGLLARVIQHEYDHLSGIEFTEKIIDYKKLMNRDFYVKGIKNSPQETKACVITIKQYSQV